MIEGVEYCPTSNNPCDDGSEPVVYNGKKLLPN